MKASVCWQSAIFQPFKGKSGVLQGSLLGTEFYNLIMGKLLFLLQKSNLGCHIGGIFVGAVAYADDLILMSASRMKLQAMLRISEEFGMLCDLKFNVVKSCAGYVHKSRSDIGVQFFLENRVLPWFDKFKYLGIVFNSMHRLQADCFERIQKFIATVSSVLRL